MTQYRIYLMKYGVYFGTWYADSPQEALRDMYAKMGIDLDIEKMRYPEDPDCMDHEWMNVQFFLFNLDGVSPLRPRLNYTRPDLVAWNVQEMES